ncbi:MAG TPA: YdcF family protein [Pyrinomonadaceae bacterium]|nr:YdcF family protein [Pyrinomonadaceae bacterium]
MSRRRILVKVLVACILIWPFVAWIGAKLLITEAPLDQADVIVVLSGSANYRERAREAAGLFLEGRSQRILITNDNMQGPWSSADQQNLFFYERSLREIRNAGVPADKIEVLMQPVASTYEEAELARQYAEEHGLRSVLIVTSAYHSRRALWVFSRVFRNTGIRIGLVSVRPGYQSPRPATWWLSLRGWKLVPTEYVKMIYYVIKY